MLTSPLGAEERRSDLRSPIHVSSNLSLHSLQRLPWKNCYIRLNAPRIYRLVSWKTIIEDDVDKNFCSFPRWRAFVNLALVVLMGIALIFMLFKLRWKASVRSEHQLILNNQHKDM